MDINKQLELLKILENKLADEIKLGQSIIEACKESLEIHVTAEINLVKDLVNNVRDILNSNSSRTRKINNLTLHYNRVMQGDENTKGLNNYDLDKEDKALLKEQFEKRELEGLDKTDIVNLGLEIGKQKRLRRLMRRLEKKEEKILDNFLGPKYKQEIGNAIYQEVIGNSYYDLIGLDVTKEIKSLKEFLSLEREHLNEFESQMKKALKKRSFEAEVWQALETFVPLFRGVLVKEENAIQIIETREKKKLEIISSIQAKAQAAIQKK